VRDEKSPCVADALFGMKFITVNGKTVGIAQLCDALATVASMDLSGEDRVTTALLAEVMKHNYIPASVRDAYGAALLDEYREMRKKNPGHR
jgi:hypothetical protein